MNKQSPLLRLFQCIALLAINTAVPAQAALVIEVGDGATIGGTIYNLQAGEFLDLDLYITQTAPTDRLNDVATSINSAEVELLLSGGSNVAFSNPIVFGNFFGDPTMSTQLEAARLYFSVGSTKAASAALGGEIPGVLASEDGVDDDSLRLGSFRLQADALASGTYTIDLAAGMAGGFNGTTTPDTPFNGVELTPSSFTVNVTAIPEPGATLCVAFLAAGFGLRRRRS